MVLNRKPEEIENLIIIQLFKHRELGFTDLSDKIHNFQREQKRNKNQSENSGTELSKPTLSYYLKRLIDYGIVQKKNGKTSKRKVYALSAHTESFSGDIATELVKLSESVKNLYTRVDKPFFGFFQKISQKERKELVGIRDELKRIARMIDFYLVSTEVAPPS